MSVYGTGRTTIVILHCSAANESSSDSDSIDPSEVAIQRAHRSSGRQDEHSIQQDLLHTGQARVRHSVFVAYSRR